MKNIYTLLLSMLFLFGASSLKAQSWSSIVSSVASSVDSSGIVSSVVDAITGEDIVGEWDYSGLAVELDADDIVSSAAGVVLAEQLEGKLDDLSANLGVDLSSINFTFNEDDTFFSTVGTKEIGGSYILDSSAGEISLDYGVYNNSINIGTLKSFASLSSGTLCLLFQGDQILTLVKAIPSISANESVALLSTIVEQYDGIKIGIELNKTASSAESTTSSSTSESVQSAISKWF